MNKFKKQSIAALAAFGLTFGLVACGDDSSSSANLIEEEYTYAGVVFDGGDYMVQEGELRWIDKDGKISEKNISFYQDSRVVTNGPDVYVLEGLGTDNISKVDPELIDKGAKKAVAWQVSFANANPVDMVFDGEEAWVALQNADSLVKISTKDGKVVKSINTKKFASKGQTSPYVADIELADGKLYVLMQRYAMDAEYNFTYPKGIVAIYDASTGKLETSIELVTKNPTAMSLYNGNLYVASLGEYDGKADDNRGIEKVDLKAEKSKLIISGKKLGAGLYGFVAEDGIAYASVYEGWGSTPLVKIDLEKKTFEKVEGIADAQKTLAIKNGVLYVGDHTYGDEKLYIYKDGELTALDRPKGSQAPYSIALF
jgi:hypothetical protein